MSIRVGDAVFIRSGLPATVQERDEASAQLKLDTDFAHVQKEMRHGYLNGLSPESRKQLYDILDKAKDSSEDPAKRVEELRVKLAELDKDPHNNTVSQYVRAEMVHIMNTNGLKPTTYSIHESKAR